VLCVSALRPAVVRAGRASCLRGGCASCVGAASIRSASREVSKEHEQILFVVPS